jgi:tetratricopeptide (TPR) repeat protein
VANQTGLGWRLQRERERHHWTQEQLAEKIGASVPSLQRWEHGRAAPRQDIYRRLADVFGRPPEQWGTSRYIPWNVPLLRNPYFTGRERILQRLYQALAAEQVVALSQTRAISGLGGIGKTQTAIEYAYRYANEYEAVLWVRADEYEALVSSFAALAVVLELPEQEEANQFRTIAAVKRWLEWHSPWLLIFDNADDLSLISDFLPRRTGGATLLTTRSQITGPHIKKVELDRMGREEGVTFLLRRMSSREDEAEASIQETSDAERRLAEELWELMDGLPLALDQAGAYIEAKQCSLADYLHLYRTHRGTLLQERGSMLSKHSDAVATTWLISLQRVEQQSPAAAELLRMLAFLSPDAISEEILIEGASFLGDVLAPVASDPFRLNQAIEVLRTYSLVKRDPKEKTLSIHRLVQVVLQDAMTMEHRERWIQRAISVLDTLFPLPDPEVWRQCERLFPHVLLYTTTVPSPDQVPTLAYLLHKAGSYLEQRAQYKQAELLDQRALQLREQALGPDHLDVAGPLINLANVYAFQGKYEKAEPLYQRALHIREQGLGSLHPDVAVLLHDLADLYADQNKYKEAELLYQRALQIREPTLGLYNWLTATTLNNLGTLYARQGEYMRAEQSFLQVQQILEQLLGPSHFRLGYPLSNLALIYAEQGKNELSVPLFQRALQVLEAKEPQHPLVAGNLHGLARIYVQQGNFEQAESMFQRALQIYEQALGPTHINVAAPLTGLADLYYKQGNYREAELHYRRALQINGQMPGPTYSEMAEAMDSLAQLRIAEGSREEARAWYTRTLSIRELELGTHHPKTIETRMRLIDLLLSIGQHEEATQLEADQAVDEQGRKELPKD